MHLAGWPVVAPGAVAPAQPSPGPAVVSREPGIHAHTRGRFRHQGTAVAAAAHSTLVSTTPASTATCPDLVSCTTITSACLPVVHEKDTPPHHFTCSETMAYLQ